MKLLLVFLFTILTVFTAADTGVAAADSTGESLVLDYLETLPENVLEVLDAMHEEEQQSVIEMLDEYDVVLTPEGELEFQLKMKFFSVSVKEELETESFDDMKTELSTLEAKAVEADMRERWANDQVLTVHQVYSPQQCATLPHQDPGQEAPRYRFRCDVEHDRILVDVFEKDHCIGKSTRKIWKDDSVTAVCGTGGFFVELDFETADNFIDPSLGGVDHSSFWECDCSGADQNNPILTNCLLLTLETERYEAIFKKRIVADGGDAICRPPSGGEVEAEETETEMYEDSDIATDMEDSDIATEAEDTGMATEAEDTGMATEAEDTGMATEAEDTVMATEAEDTVMATEAEDTGMATVVEAVESTSGSGRRQMWSKVSKALNKKKKIQQAKKDKKIRKREKAKAKKRVSDWKFGKCNGKKMVRIGKRLTKKLKKCANAAGAFLKAVGCNIVRWTDKVCDKVKKCKKLPWPLNKITCSIVDGACKQVKKWKKDCSGAYNFKNAFQKKVKTCVENNFNWLAPKCGVTTPIRHKKGRRSLPVVLAAGLGLSKWGKLPKFGGGLEIGAGLTIMGQAFSWGVGLVITADGYAVAYHTSEQGIATEIAEGQVYYSELVVIPSKKCFLGSGKVWGLGASAFDVFGLAVYHAQCTAGNKMTGTSVGLGRQFSVGLGVSPVEAWHHNTNAKAFWTTKV